MKMADQPHMGRLTKFRIIIGKFFTVRGQVPKREKMWLISVTWE